MKKFAARQPFAAQKPLANKHFIDSKEDIRVEKFWQSFWDACLSKTTLKGASKEQISELVDSIRILKNQRLGAVKALFSEVRKQPIKTASALLMGALTIDMLVDAIEAIEVARLTRLQSKIDEAARKFDEWIIALGVDIALIVVTAASAKLAKTAVKGVTKSMRLVNAASKPKVIIKGGKQYLRVYHYTTKKAAKAIAKEGLKSRIAVMGAPGYKKFLPGYGKFYNKLFVTTRSPDKFTRSTFKLLVATDVVPTHCVELLVPRNRLGVAFRSILLQEKGAYFIKKAFMTAGRVPPSKLARIAAFTPIKNPALEAAELSILAFRKTLIGGGLAYGAYGAYTIARK